MTKPPKDNFDPELYWEQTLQRLSASPLDKLIALVRGHAEAFQAREQGLAEPTSRKQNLELAALAQVQSERDQNTLAAVNQWKTGVENKPSGPVPLEKSSPLVKQRVCTR